MSLRYDPSKRMAELRRKFGEEMDALSNLKQALRDFKPTDKHGWTHYDYANFSGANKGDLQVAIEGCERRIRDLRRQMDEATRDEDDLVY